jgi:hypothetical protein
MKMESGVQPDISQKINEFMTHLLRVCPTLHRSKVTFIGETALTVLQSGRVSVSALVH